MCVHIHARCKVTNKKPNRQAIRRIFLKVRKRIKESKNLTLLAQRDGALAADDSLAGRQVLLAERFDLVGHAAALVGAGTGATLLDERVDLSFEETTLAVDLDFGDGCIARNARQTDVIGGAEIAEAVGNEAALVDLHTTDDVRAVAIDDIGTVVYAEVCQLTQRTAVLAEERLCALRQMALRAPFGTAVEGDDDQVAAHHQVVDDASHDRQVGMLQRVAVVPEGAQPYLQTLALDDGTLHATGNAREEDALLAQHPLGGLDAHAAKVVGVVVGHAEIVVASLFQQVTVAGGRAEGVGVRAGALGARTAVAEGALQVAEGQVGTCQHMLDILEDVGTVVGRQHTRGERGAHHDVARHGYRQRIFLRYASLRYAK